MSVRVGSPRPKIPQLAVADGVAKPKEKAAMAEVTALLKPGDVDEFLKARAALKGRGLLPSMSALLDKAPKTSEQGTQAIQTQLNKAVGELAEVYRDGLVTENELDLLGRAGQRLDHIAALFEPAIMNMLPRDVRERLQNDLVPAIHTLRIAAEDRGGDVVEGMRKNLEWVKEHPEPEYGWLDLGALAQHGGSIAGLDRYAPGDLLSVPRSDGSASLGVVQSVGAGALVAEFLDVDGSVNTKNLAAAQVVEANPLKIGDCIDTPEGRVWVTGSGPGGLTGTRREEGGQRMLGLEQLTTLGKSLAKHLGDMRAGRANASAAVAEEAEPRRVDPQVLVAAGGFESTRPDTVRGAGVSGAVFTWRGIGYADYNEDGAVLGVIPKGKGVAHETAFAGAFDQAGGEGHVKNQTGAASLIAARTFADAAQKIAAGGSAEALMKGAVVDADREVKGLHANAATTFAAAVVQNGVAHVVNCGDSAVMVFDKNGRLKGQTEAHNLGDEMAKRSGDPNAGLKVANVITACLGGDNPQADYSRFNVEKGDVIVCVSDGVADANLSAQKKDFAAGKPWSELNGERTTREIASLIPGKDAAGVTQAIIDYAKEHVLDGRGKSDNVTASVLVVG